MKQYRLLIDLEVVRDLDLLPKRERLGILTHLDRIRESPDRFSDFSENDASGRRLEVSVVEGLAVHYWIDFADRHVKILALHSADR